MNDIPGKYTKIVERYKENGRVPVIIDLSNIAYRSSFVFTPDKFVTSQGVYNGHLFGICQNIKTLLKLNYEVYLCRDLRSTFRQYLVESYKSNREHADGSVSIHDILNKTINPLISTLKNVHTISSTGYEADDVMFSLSKICDRNETPCYILSTDKDLCQALSEYTTIAHKFIAAGPQEIVTSSSEYYEKNFGNTPPKFLPLYRAFKGDASDNLEAPIKRFPKDLIQEFIEECKINFPDGNINLAEMILKHNITKKSHEKWLSELKDKNTFTKLFNNFKVMRLIEIPVYEEDEALVDNAFNIITEKYELWSFRKFVREYNGGV